ncbi:MAG: type I restriction endonuclease [Actinomycetota bacterium]
MTPVGVDEAAFEAFIAESLVSSGGWQAVRVGTGPDIVERFDLGRGIDREDLFAFISATQGESWSQLMKLHGGEAAARSRFSDRLAKELDARGTVDVLRHGVVDVSVTIRLAYFRPAHGLTPDLMARYDANRLTVVRQLRYEAASANTIDLCLLVNGIPVATAELKNPLTGQTVEDAIEQYRRDRDPRNVTLARRAVVHFAVDTESVAMTTRLAGAKTRFLPFNKGNDRSAGNPPNPSGHRSAYLWEEVWQRDAWLDLLARYIHVEKPPKGSKQPPSVIFPRYHQWDAVRRVEADARETGAGASYLVQHSAGSGKSNTIAWLAHRLSTLHDERERKVFDKVVVITDRVVLDRQLQDTIFQFEHAHGVVERIDRDSRQLEEALAGERARIIITTLQKFPVVLERGVDLPDRRYAVIVDEAHSSQTGDAARDLKAVLGAPAEEQLAQAESEDREAPGEPPDTLLDALQTSVAARGRQPNLSFFAFTATPKARTLELFGTWDEKEKRHRPFHLYSMRQAIEEGFILDVLQNYVTYETYWRIEKAILEDPSYEARAAQAAIARFVSLHEHNLAQKAEIIVEHFRRHVARRIGGKAKAMVVTSSRLHAVRYKRALDAYIREKGYGDVHALVAFSGTVTDDGLDFTESNMNKVPESQTAEQFGTDSYQVLVVAEKFQTGYDQPLLYAMYVDKTLSGLAAVQTLSRLNRIADGKDGTFILDFRNDADGIRKAFEPYFGETVAPRTDPNLLFDVHAELAPFGVLRDDEVTAVAELLVRRDDPAATAKVYAALSPAVERFHALDEDDQGKFREALSKFVRLYSFLSQVAPFGDTRLERDYLFSKALASLIRKAPGESLDLGAEVELTHLRQEQTFAGSVALDANIGEVQTVFGEGRGTSHHEVDSLSSIIEKMNARFGTDLTDTDRLFFDQVIDDLANDSRLQVEAAANDLEGFALGMDKVFTQAIAGRLSRNEAAAFAVLDNADLRAGLIDAYLPALHAKARVARQAVCPIGDLLGPDRENRFLEYKATLRWDINQQSKTTGIPESAVVKTVAGFLNSEFGGTLLIGVADDGTVRGLEDDYATFSKRGHRGDQDLFGQHLQSILLARLGHAAMANVNWEFQTVDGHDLCRIQITPSDVPVFEAKDAVPTFWWRYPVGTTAITNELERGQIIGRRWRRDGPTADRAYC